VLRDSKGRAKTPRGLRTVKVHKYIEKDLLGEKYRAKDREARGQAKPEP
jgi:hypothetical protein